MGKTLLNLIKTRLDVLPPEESFLVDLKATVSAENPPRKRSSHYKPSSLNCMRIMYFDRVQAPIDSSYNDYSGIRICETGSNSHENIQHYISLMSKYGKPCDWVDVEQYVKEHNLDFVHAPTGENGSIGIAGYADFEIEVKGENYVNVPVGNYYAYIYLSIVSRT